MDQSLYRYSLYIAIPLMLFFGFHMLFARVPDKKIFSNYLLSRRLMGIALLILAGNYSAHFFFALRQKDIYATVLINLSTYFLCYWLFSSAMMTLLDIYYIKRRRFICHIANWVLFSVLSCIVILFNIGPDVKRCCIIVLTAWLVFYGLILSIRLLKTYSRAKSMLKNTHSDDIESYIRWLSIFTYWAIGFGVSCGLLTFLPDKFVFIWILSSIPFYIYLYCCYQNYILFYEKVEIAILEDLNMCDSDEPQQSNFSVNDCMPILHSEIEQRIKDWIVSESYREKGITLNELSAQLGTNRTYLSEYINRVYHLSFRDWILDLRIDYAKNLMIKIPNLKIHEVSELSGFISLSHFSRSFSEKEHCSPARWRKNNLG